MHSFNELNLLDSMEVRGHEVCYDEVCQITQNPFHTTKQIHSLWPKTVCGLRNSCLSKSSVLDLNIGLPDPLTWGQLLTRSLHLEKHWSFFSSCRDHPKLALIETLCAPQNLCPCVSKDAPLNCFSLTCSTVTKTPSQTHSTDGWHGACEDTEGLSSFWSLIVDCSLKPNGYCLRLKCWS